MATIKCNEPKFNILSSGGRLIAHQKDLPDAVAALMAEDEQQACPEPIQVLGLRITYQTAGDIPTNVLGNWNTLFDLPANGTAFTDIVIEDATVVLQGGAGITLKASLFRTNEKIISIVDEVDCVTAIAGGKNSGAISLMPNLETVTLNAVITVGYEGLFTNVALSSVSLNSCITFNAFVLSSCAALTDISLPSLTTMGDGTFTGCTLIEAIYLPLCVTLGSTTGDNSVFSDCNSLTSVTVPTALATVDGGNPDGDLVYADVTLGATITYI